jgi:hypothetical protein
MFILFLFLILFSPIQGNAFDTESAFWNSPKKGANMFNKIIDPKDIGAAKVFGIQFIRLSPDKFITSKRDFLIGDADKYTGLVPEDLAYLKKILDVFHAQKMPVVLTMLSLPGSRWKQNNNNKDDLRLWKNRDFQNQSIQFWKDLVQALKDHPAIVGFNILNEPHPERLYDIKSVDIHEIAQEEVQDMLFQFYQRVVSEIRKIAPHTPIILDSSSYANPNTFSQLKPINFPHILYSFHMYEPYSYTNLKINKGRFSYPGKIEGKVWDNNKLKAYMESVLNFQKLHKIPAHQILVGEFGGNRQSKVLGRYFQDLIGIFKEQGWHFAIYAFREDVWEGMDYELGNKKLPWRYWKAIEEGKTPELKRSDNPLFDVVKSMWQ